MTIRFTCAECASVLKIKDELAGTAARCPKCKTKFVVPPAESVPAESAPVAKSSSNPAAVLPCAAPPEPKEEQVVSVATPVSSTETLDSAVATPPSPDFSFPTPPEDPEESSPESAPVAPLTDDAFPPPVDSALSPPLDDDDFNDADSAESAFNDDEDGANEDDSQVAYTGASSAAADDDDDLDSPPLLVGAGSARPLSDSSLHALDLNKDDHTKPPNKNQGKNPNSGSKKPGDDAFDPLKYLMADSSSPKRNSLSSHMQDDSDLSLSDDSDYDVLSRPTPHPVSRPAPMVAPSRPTPEKVDLATAAKMMKKAIKDSTAEAARQRDAKPQFDYLQAFREIGIEGLIKIVGAILLIVGCSFLGNYAFSTGPIKTPKLGYVAGSVTLDGQPLAGAEVFFEPMGTVIEGSKRERPRTSFAITDNAGKFKMMYLPGDKIEGVAAGKCRVWVSHIGPNGEDVPSEWRQAQMKIVEIMEGNQKAPFDIPMKSENK